MGTKNNPSRFNCYEKAEDDEPLFTLLGRDPLASYLVAIWASVRKGEDDREAKLILDQMINRHFSSYADRVFNDSDMEKAIEAELCSIDMFKYYLIKVEKQRV